MRTWLFMSICCGIITAILSQCKNFTVAGSPEIREYAGSKSCNQCHKKDVNSWLHTAHFMASRGADTAELDSKLKNVKLEYYFTDKKKIVLKKKGGKYYQSLFLNDKLEESHSLDITVGGVKGENYFSWEGNSLYQLPLAYFVTLRSLSTSPGYNVHTANFDRAIKQRCLECHSSYIKKLKPPVADGLPDHFDRNSVIYGIDCERCHGPSLAHVVYQQTHPDIKTARYICLFDTLSRQQKIDICASCHSGNKSYMLRSIFNFKPGNVLNDFMLPEPPLSPFDLTNLDVHGNQLQLLAQSKCFIGSKMDCTSCHNTHVNERGLSMTYSKRCQNCHGVASNSFCKLKANTGFLNMNCVNCHMPALPSTAIRVNTAATGKLIPYLMHTHLIKIYPKETKKTIVQFKN
ncbi:MAG: multiheme c-type cytochrome [Mucilaginibacter sp.]